MTDIDYKFYPPKEYQLKWIHEYLTHYHYNDSMVITDKYVEKLYADVNKFALVAHLFWMLWGYIQAEHSEIDYDYLEYGLAFLLKFQIIVLCHKKKNRIVISLDVQCFQICQHQI